MKLITSSECGPGDPEEILTFLNDFLVSANPEMYPLDKVREAADVVRALDSLVATDVSVTISRHEVVLLWPLADVTIDINVGVGINGKSNSGGTPETNLSIVIAAISGAIDVVKYRRYLRGEN